MNKTSELFKELNNLYEEYKNNCKHFYLRYPLRYIFKDHYLLDSINEDVIHKEIAEEFPKEEIKRIKEELKKHSINPNEKYFCFLDTPFYPGDTPTEFSDTLSLYNIDKRILIKIERHITLAMGGIEYELFGYTASIFEFKSKNFILLDYFEYLDEFKDVEDIKNKLKNYDNKEYIDYYILKYKQIREKYKEEIQKYWEERSSHIIITHPEDIDYDENKKYENNEYFTQKIIYENHFYEDLFEKVMEELNDKDDEEGDEE